jgi:hypothetical protein
MRHLKKAIPYIMILLMMLSVACRSNADQSTVLVGDVFTLGVGGTAVIPSENLTITFVKVPDDSRCPTTVSCAWTGEARAVVTVQQAEGKPVELEFNTNPAPPVNQQTLTFGDYSIELQSLDPYPQDIDAIKANEYRVTMIVTKQ